MERKNWADAPCPMARSIDVIGEWGSLLILREAFGGTTRFDDFQKKLGLSRNLLTTRLKSLVDGGVLERRPVSATARRHEYVLTEMGDDLIATIVALRQWGDRWLFRPAPHPADMVDGLDGSKVKTLVVCSSNGRIMSRRDLRLKATARPEERTPQPPSQVE